MQRLLADHEAPCLLFPDFLSGDEVQALRAQLEQRGFAGADSHYPPSYRNNRRQVFDDAALAATLLPRVQRLLEAAEVPAPSAINPHWRSCQYRPGQAFPIHQDGVWHAPDGSASRLTFMVYLSDPEAFAGGDTVFYDGPPDRRTPPRALLRIRPPTGALIVFDHTLWHAGDTVTAGCKTILRSELMYPADASGVEPGGHRGYVFCLAALADGRVLSGGRDGTLRLQTPAGVGQTGTVVGRHRQSVLGIAVEGLGRIAAVGRDGALQLHASAGARAAIAVRAHEGAALCVGWTASGSLLTGGADRTLACWSDAGVLRWRQQRHRGWLWDLAVLADGRTASVGEDGQLLLWSGDAVVAALDLGAPLRSVCAGVDGLVVGDADGRLHRICVDAAGPRVQRSVAGHHAQVRRVRPDATSGGVLSAGEDGGLLRWSPGLDSAAQVARRANFATDFLRTAHGQLVSAGYSGGVHWHGND